MTASGDETGTGAAAQNDPTGMPGTRNAPTGGSGRRPLVVVAAVVLAAVVALALVLTLGSRGDGGAQAAPTSASPSTGTVAPLPPTPTPTGPTEDVDEPPPSLPEVPLDSPAAVGDGVVASITGIEAIQGTGVGPGNIAGPALRVTLRIENGTADAIWLDGVAVNLSYGADRTPAPPLDDSSQLPFRGTVGSGESDEGVYVFSVPTDVRDLVTVEVGYRAGAPLLLFTGAAP